MDTFDKEELLYLRECVRRYPHSFSAGAAEYNAKLREKINNMIGSVDECAAASNGHSITPNGPNGELQCRYCGEPAQPKVFVDSWWQLDGSTGEVSLHHKAIKDLPDWVTNSGTFRVTRGPR